MLVAGVSAASAALHEPWRDELHTWLVARELTAVEMWREMRWEGHVMLWQLALHPFARGGAPATAMGLRGSRRGSRRRGGPGRSLGFAVGAVLAVEGEVGADFGG